MIYKSSSANGTKRIAAGFAKKILKSDGGKNKSALIIGLVGDLGAGKTTFIQGFAHGLKIKHKITSPTFIIFRNYPLKKIYKNFLHVDAYRLRGARELKTLGFKKMFGEPRNIILIEWAEKIKKLLPRKTIWINFEPGKKENERVLEVSNF